MTRKLIRPEYKSQKVGGAYTKDAPAPDLGPFKLDKHLFDRQLKFVEDPRPFKIAVCSRRSGKTISCAADLIDTALNNPSTNSLYITLSRNNAKKLIWPEIMRINRDYKLGGSEDMTELSMTFPNGAIIYLSGAKDATEIEKFRGLALKKAYIDECQSFRPYIADLVDDVISPALMDYAGTLCLIGTPGPIPAGYFYNCAEKSDAWSKHGWTFFDNPFIASKSKKTHQELLDRELKRRGVTADDPSIQREFFGRWVLDSNSLWIRYSSEKNHFIEMEKGDYTYILGIDLGYEDADALALLAYCDTNPYTYLVEEKLVRKQGLTELVADISDLQKRYDISKMIIDEGGLGKKLAEEMRRRFHLPVQGADKARKQENAALLNDALRRGHFKAKSGSQFAQDSYLVEIDQAKSRPDKLIISDQYHSDIIDAVLYAFKESPAFTFQPPEPKLKPGTREWAEAQEDSMFEAELEGLTAEHRRRGEGLE